MYMKLVASVVIAALLMTGGAAAAAQVTEYGVQPTKEANLSIGETGVKTLAPEEAKAIALKHEGLTEEKVTGLRSEYDVERGIPEWDIDFRSGDWEYDYEIHAETGAVIKEKKEYENLESEIMELEAEKSSIEQEMSSGMLDNSILMQKSMRIQQVIELIDEKSMRWLELSEFA